MFNSMTKRFCRRAALSLLAIGGIASYSDAADQAKWPQFRGPSAQGVAEMKDLPTHWSPTENVAWKTDLPGLGWSSPIVVNDRIYCTTAIPDSKNEEDFQLALQICDLKTGKLITTVPIYEQHGRESPQIHSKNSHASSTPIYHKGRLYLHFGHQGTACSDLEGKIIWKTRELAYPPTHGNGGSPVIYDDKLIFNCDGSEKPFVVALNLKDGKVAWRVNRPVQAEKSFSFSTPTLIEVDGKVQLITAGSDIVQALDPSNGQEIWHVNYDGFSVVPRPIFSDGIVVLSSGYMRPVAIAIDPTGTGDITKSHVLWKKNNVAPNTPSMIAHNELVFMVNDAGVATCLDIKTGDEKWKKRIGGNYSSSPLLANGLIYFQSEAGAAKVLRADDKGEEVDSAELPGRIFASYAVADSSLIIRSETSLYRIAK